VQQQRAALERKQQVLRTPARGLDPLTRNTRRQVRLDTPSKSRLVHEERTDAPTDDMGFDAAPGGLDFGEFRHA